MLFFLSWQQNHTLVASNLLAPILSSNWSVPVQEVGFSAADFMASLEQLFIISGLILDEGTLLREEQLLITTIGENPLSPMLRLTLSDRSAHISIPNDLTTPTTRVTIAMISNLGPWLRKMYTFNTSAINFTVATPLISVQAINGIEMTEVNSLATPINITLPYRAIVS